MSLEIALYLIFKLDFYVEKAGISQLNFMHISVNFIGFSKQVMLMFTFYLETPRQRQERQNVQGTEEKTENEGKT